MNCAAWRISGHALLTVAGAAAGVAQGCCSTPTAAAALGTNGKLRELEQRVSVLEQDLELCVPRVPWTTQCVRVTLKAGSLERVRAWQSELNSRGAEVLETLKDENVVVESVFLDRVAGVDYLVYYMRAQNMERARQTAQRSTHAIDKYHSDFMKAVVESGEKLECLIDFDRISR